VTPAAWSMPRLEDRTGLIVPGVDERSHKRRMLDGDPFFGPDPELLADSERAAAACAEHARLFPTDPIAAMTALAAILKEPGAMMIRPPVTIEFGYQISLGRGGYMMYGCYLVDNGAITIGDGALIGPGVHLNTASHPLDAASRATAIDHAHPIVIGARAWIGAGAIVLGGVTIGDEAVIGAGAVVTKDIPPRTVAVGSPARVIREL
jgi:maltose O-acetyltransferase